MTVYYVALGIGILAGIGGQILLKAGADAPDAATRKASPRPTRMRGGLITARGR